MPKRVSVHERTAKPDHPRSQIMAFNVRSLPPDRIETGSGIVG